MASVGKKGVFPEMNVVPLIDVVLVLLIIFMVITPLMVKEMDIEVPEKAEVEMLEQLPQNQLVINLQADRTVYVNKELVPLDELADKLQRIMNAREKKKRVVFIDVADAVAYGDAMQIMDIARGAGVEKIGIIEEHRIMGAGAPGEGPATP